MEKHKYYHATSAKLKEGDIITGCNPNKNYDFCKDMVYLTTSPYPHWTIHDDFAKSNKQYFIYEVKPMDKIYYGDDYDELMTKQAYVVKKIGNVSLGGKGLGGYSSGVLDSKVKKIIKTKIMPSAINSNKPRYRVYKANVYDSIGKFITDKLIRSFDNLQNAIDYAKKNNADYIFDSIKRQEIKIE